MGTMCGYDLAAEALINENVEVVFTLSGVPLFGVYDSLVRKGVRLVDVRHEQAAVLMAQGYARTTGRPGVAIVAPGPGVLNAVTGIANCFQGSAPVVVLSGTNRLPEFQLKAFHEMDHVELLRPITKWAATAYEAHRVAEYVSIAFREATSGLPGPAFVDFPQTTLEGQVEPGQAILPTRYRTTARPHGDPELVQEAIGLLARARRPLIVYGSGILWSRAHEELRAFVEATGIPSVPTPLARGCLPDDHPLSCFSSRSRAMAEADVVLFVGARLNFILGFGRPPRFQAEAKAIQVDIAPQEIGRNRAIDVGIVGDAKAVLGQMLQEWKRTLFTCDGSWPKALKEVEAGKERRWEKWIRSDERPINPIRLCHEIARFLERDAIVTVDGGEILDFARNLIPTFAPGGRLNPGVTGLLGVGIPYAIAAKLVHPERQVLSICGDGAFGMNAMELDTAARQGLPIVVVLANNACWNVCAAAQKGTFGDNRAFATQLSSNRYHLLAQALDCYGETVEDPDEIHPALERAFRAGRPALLNVITDPNTREYTMSQQLRALPLTQKHS